eukprot:c23854_g1_i1 orf=349-1215(-)
MAGWPVATHSLGSVKPIEANKQGMMVPSMKEIREGVFIGDMLSASRVLSDPDHLGITYMLSLVSSTILSSFCTVVATAPQMAASSEHRRLFCSLEVAKKGSSLVRMVIPLNDNPDEDILLVLQPCVDFINEARRRSGAILVHCVAGVSRSATVVTAYLMQKERLPLTAALQSLRQKQKKASPNSGFLRQLQLFQHTDFTLDNSSMKEAATDEQCIQSRRVSKAVGTREHVSEANLAAEEPCFRMEQDAHTMKFNFALVFGAEEALLHRHIHGFEPRFLFQGNLKCLSA